MAGIRRPASPIHEWPDPFRVLWTFAVRITVCRGAKLIASHTRGRIRCQLCAHEAVSLDSAQQKVPACFHNCSGNSSYGRSSSMAVFMTFPVLTRVAGTRAGPMPRVKYGSGVRTGPASRLVGWANIQPAAAPAPGHGPTGDRLAGICALMLTSVKCHTPEIWCSSRRGVV